MSVRRTRRRRPLGRDLRISLVGAASLGEWLHVHNEVIRAAPLDLDQARERLTRNRLWVAHCTGNSSGTLTSKMRPSASKMTAAAPTDCSRRSTEFACRFGALKEGALAFDGSWSQRRISSRRARMLRSGGAYQRSRSPSGRPWMSRR